MKKFIYQDPRRKRTLSRPIDETDVKARKILEDVGWLKVETIDDGVEAVPAADAPASVSTETGEGTRAEVPAAPAAAPKAGKKGKGKQAPAAAPEA